MESVTLKKGIWDIAANLFLPEEFAEGKKYPAVLFVHPSGGVKEQAAGLYAGHMAGMGFVTVAFDATHYGESGGEPRYLENPMERIGDIFAVVDYLQTLSYVDGKKIGVVGIGTGGGYAVAAAALDHRIGAVAGISFYDIGARFRDGFSAEEKGSVKEQIIALQTAGYVRTLMARGHEPIYNFYVLPCGDAVREDAPAIVKEAYEYYRTERGGHPNSNNKVLASSAMYIMNFDPLANLDTLLTQPLLLIGGDISDSLCYSERAYEKAGGEKELFLIKGATHIALYDIPEYVGQAVERMTAFFRKQAG